MVVLVLIVSFIVVALLFQYFKNARDSYQKELSTTFLTGNDPVVDQSKKYCFNIYVAGINYHRYDEIKAQKLIKDYSKYTLVREPKNYHDSNAVAIHIEGLKAGYIPAYEASFIAPMIDNGDQFTIHLISHHPRRKYDKLELDIVNETRKIEVESADK